MKKITLIYSIIYILIVILIFISNNFFNSNNLTNEDLELNKSISIEHLVDTCPRNRQCTIPTCSLWSDINNDGLCDRSIVE
jgi:hypothetical protein